MPYKRLINFTIIIRILSYLLVVISLFMVSGVVVALAYGEPVWPLILSALITGAFGGILLFILRNDTNKNIGKREGYLIVSLSWVVVSVFGTLPYILSGAIPSFTNAFFETMSGFTTTGATILDDIEAVPKNILFWRAMTHWLGGMGIIVLTVAILPFLGIGGMQLLVAEMPGITPDKLRPRITDTAKRLWGIYVILTFAETLILWLGEMNFFDAICHSFATMATGGFSTKNDSITSFSPFTQYVIALFMIFAGTNFTIHYLALHKKFDRIWANQEFKTYAGIIVIVTLTVTIGLLVFHTFPTVESAFRDALFTVVSILTTTGFVTADYYSWPVFLWVIIFMLMFIGGSAGSTGGGVKVVRHLLLFKNSWTELKRAIHPQAVIPVKFNGKSVSQQIIFNVMAFFLLYMLIFATGVVVMTFVGTDFETSIGAVAATLGNIGPGVGHVEPTSSYSFFGIFSKWFLSFLMLLGRLELFTVLLVISPTFWKN